MCKYSLSTWSSSSDGESMSSAELNSSDRMGIPARRKKESFWRVKAYLPHYIINYKKIATGYLICDSETHECSWVKREIITQE